MIITDSNSTAKYQPILQQHAATRQEGHKSSGSPDTGNGLRLLKTDKKGIYAENSKAVQPDRISGMEQPTEAPGQEETEQAAEKLEKTLAEFKHNKLEFTVHEETGRTIVKVVDQESGEVIKELPPEELLDLAAKLEEMSGVLFDKKI
jgi:flagellar protein FlaG